MEGMSQSQRSSPRSKGSRPTKGWAWGPTPGKQAPEHLALKTKGLMFNVPVNFRALRILKDTVSCSLPWIVFPRVTADVPKPFVLFHCFFNSIHFQGGWFEMRHKMWSWKIFYPCFKGNWFLPESKQRCSVF